MGITPTCKGYALDPNGSRHTCPLDDFNLATLSQVHETPPLVVCKWTLSIREWLTHRQSRWQGWTKSVPCYQFLLFVQRITTLAYLLLTTEKVLYVSRGLHPLHPCATLKIKKQFSRFFFLSHSLFDYL